MNHFPRYCLLSTAVLAVTLLAVSTGQRLGNRSAAPRSLDDWDIREVADHLNRAGLNVQLHSPRKDGMLVRSAYLTTTHKDWGDLNRLGIDPGPSRIQEWDGIVYCQRIGEHCGPMFPLGDDHSLVVGPFFFYGDAELLQRIGAILVPSAPPSTPNPKRRSTFAVWLPSHRARI